MTVSGSRTTPPSSLFSTPESECDHPRDQWKFLRTREDFFDGDEDDIYQCQKCGKQIEEYIPR